MTDKQKRIIAIVVAVLALGLLVHMTRKNLGSEEFAANTWTLKDSETGELVKIPTADLKPYPMLNPKTGKQTLCVTELCLWGDECRKKGGTHVIMNEILKKEGPTKCPVCGHVVRFRNPVPPDYVPGEE
ncbi:MAG: hypothetical protein GY842_00185 [bacterium]|nr:hypothetical protein [bacterium]